MKNRNVQFGAIQNFEKRKKKWRYLFISRDMWNVIWSLGKAWQRNRLITLFKFFECIHRCFLSFFNSNTRSTSEVDVHLCIYTLHSFAYVCIYVGRQRDRQACNKFKTSLYFLDRCETPDDFKYKFNQFFFLFVNSLSSV